MKNFKNIQYIVLIALLSPLKIFSQQQVYTINATISNIYDDKYIKYYSVHDDDFVIDSILVKDGKFTIKGPLKNINMMHLSTNIYKKENYVEILVDSEVLHITIQDSLHKISNFSNALARDNHILDMQTRSHYESIAQGKSLNPQQRKAFESDKNIMTVEFIKNNTSSLASLYHLENLSYFFGYNYGAIYPIYSLLSAHLKNSSTGRSIYEKILKQKNPLVDNNFMDFEFTAINGDKIKLGSIVKNNKYTLLDYWASWCAPCRAENPHVVKTYTSLSKEGFNVVSISLDEDRNKWLKAIETDGMPWIHGSELIGYKDKTTELYKIRGIPFNVLIDQSGKIVASNLRGDALYLTIKNLMM